MRQHAIILLLSALATLAGNIAQADQPNVLLIISDDQAWTDYGFMGHEVIETPNLDKLAKESATFKRGYEQSLPPQPGDDDHRVISASARHHRQRSAQGDRPQ